MLFEVLWNGVVLMRTADIACVDPPDALRGMQAAGYVLQLDGKTWASKMPLPAKQPRPKRYIVPSQRCAELDGAVQMTL